MINVTQKITGVGMLMSCSPVLADISTGSAPNLASLGIIPAITVILQLINTILINRQKRKDRELQDKEQGKEMGQNRSVRSSRTGSTATDTATAK